MEFKKCSIDGAVYDGRVRKHHQMGSMGSVSSFQSQNPPLQSSRSVFSFRAAWIEGVHESLGQREITNSMPKLDSPQSPAEPHGEPRGWFDPAINEYLTNADLSNTVHGIAVRDFFTLLSICHTVLVDDKVNEKEENAEDPPTEAVSKQGEQPVAAKTISYKAQSPDEACLVTLAAEMGYIFKRREQNSQTEQSEIIIEALGKEMRYTLLHVLEFDSDRKRMSVIVRTPSFTPDKKGDVILFCKGADSIVFERLLPGQTEMVNKTTRHLEKFAQDGMYFSVRMGNAYCCIGLRTLCLAYRKLPEEFYEQWSTRYFDTLTTVYPDQAMRVRALDVLNNEVETKLVLLGATAIEDKLQEGVPECITTLANAGIKIWVLTGDKIETAINVGFLCGLLKTTETIEDNPEAGDAEMVLIQVKNANTEDEIHRQLTGAMDKFFAGGKPIVSPITSNRSGLKSPSIRKQEYALIIDGQSLKFALESESMTALLLDLGCRCKAVVCCRVSPLQKAKVVEMVKRGKKVLTLAIGDGANDVSMIQVSSPERSICNTVFFLRLLMSALAFPVRKDFKPSCAVTMPSHSSGT